MSEATEEEVVESTPTELSDDEARIIGHGLVTRFITAPRDVRRRSSINPREYVLLVSGTPPAAEINKIQKDISTLESIAKEIGSSSDPLPADVLMKLHQFTRRDSGNPMASEVSSGIFSAIVDAIRVARRDIEVLQQQEQLKVEL
jgi:hypothetical protein